MPLYVTGDQIQPSQSVKVLRITLDQGLRYKEPLEDKTEKAYKAARVVRKLQGPSASSMRQLFTTMVAPVMDHTSPIW